MTCPMNPAAIKATRMVCDGDHAEKSINFTFRARSVCGSLFRVLRCVKRENESQCTSTQGTNELIYQNLTGLTPLDCSCPIYRALGAVPRCFESRLSRCIGDVLGRR